MFWLCNLTFVRNTLAKPKLICTVINKKIKNIARNSIKCFFYEFQLYQNRESMISTKFLFLKRLYEDLLSCYDVATYIHLILMWLFDL
jgi:hypothetical protein